jgi:hypothetical protein
MRYVDCSFAYVRSTRFVKSAVTGLPGSDRWPMGARRTSAPLIRGIVVDICLSSRYCILRIYHHLSALQCTLETIAMASIVRPGLLRQACTQPAASQRMLSTITSSAINRPLAQPMQAAFQRSAIPKSARIAAFHATQPTQILPPLPQKIIGTTNDPTPVPNPDYAHGSYHWSFERCGPPRLCKRRTRKKIVDDAVQGHMFDNRN